MILALIVYCDLIIFFSPHYSNKYIMIFPYEELTTVAVPRVPFALLIHTTM